MDIWRGLACLMIVVVHSAHFAGDAPGPSSAMSGLILGILSRLRVGVPIFFVISGYCISATAESSVVKRNWRQFFYRRFRRIYPTYWFVVAISIILTVSLSVIGQADLVSSEYGYFPPPIALSWSQWLGNITLTETFRPHLFGDPELKILGVAWTLCYEEQFYFVCGLLLLILPHRFFLGATVVSALTLLAAVFCGPEITGFFFDGRWLMFAIGILVYYVLKYGRSRALTLYVFSGLILLTATIKYWPKLSELAGGPNMRDRQCELFVSALFGGLLIALHPWDKRIAQLRALRPLKICGQMCYSLYLIHWPVSIVVSEWMHKCGVRSFWATILFSAPVSIALSLAAGWLFHMTIERRFLNLPSPSQELPANLAPGIVPVTT